MRSSWNLFFVLIPVFFAVLTGCSSSGNSTGPNNGMADFSLAVMPASLTVTAGSTGTMSVSALASGSFNSPVTVTLNGLPSGVSTNATSYLLTPGVPQTITLTAASSAAAVSNVAVTLTGTSGTLSHTASGMITVAAASVTPTGDFSLSVMPSSVTLAAGSIAQQISILATPMNSFSGPITVTLSGLPAGVSSDANSYVLTPGNPQIINFTAAPGAAAASNVPVTLTGTSGMLSHTATETVSVTAATVTPISDFSLSVAPTSITLQDNGVTQTVAVTANAVNGFSGSVAMQISGLPSGVTATPSALTLTPGVSQNISFAATNAATGPASVTITGTSGTLNHSVPLALTLTPAASFTLSVSPAAQTLTIGNTNGAQIAVTATPANGYSGQVSVTFSGLPTGVTANPASLTLNPGTAQNVTLTAGYTASPGGSTVSFNGASGTLTSSANLALTLQTYPVSDVTTYHYDNARDGLNAQETILTPANVNASTFGKTGFYATDGKVDAAPLFAAQVATDQGTSNLVFVATEHDSVYAFNAANGAQVWKSSMLAGGESTATNGCSQITPEIGVTSTPVIDRAAGVNGTIFVVAMSKDSSGGYHQRLHALDLGTGVEQAGSPTEITASYPGNGDNSSNGNVVFDPTQYAERVGLLLLNGTIYTGWTSHCDQRPYTGWIMGFSESTLQQTQVLNLTPNGSEGAVWMAGNGLAADNAGNIYLLDANGSFQDTFNAFGFPSDGDYGNAILKLSTANLLQVSDFFEIYNSDTESNEDLDIGSGGALLLPDQVDANGNTRHMVVGAGKDHNIYVADRDNMGKFNTATQDNSNVYQQVTNALANGAWSSPAYFNQTVYYAGQGDTLKAFPITNARLATTPSSHSSTTFSYPGSTPSVSANGTSNGIVWALQDSTGSAAVLHAYDATNLSNELYNSNQTQPNGSSSTFGNGNKFITPVVANGNVYVGTPNGVAVFGLLPQ